MQSKIGTFRLGQRPIYKVPSASRLAPVRSVMDEDAQLQRVVIKAIPIDEENFKPYGQLIGPTDDGKLFDSEDAQLVLDRGTPRFYIMRLPRRGRCFTRITYHSECTQCLGSLNPGHWYLVVSAPSGSVEAHPQLQDLTAFRIPQGKFVKLHMGTWHAGPLFDDEYQDFYNLELKDTNVTDHNTHDFRTQDVEVEVEDQESTT